jgi:hypothetical protein
MTELRKCMFNNGDIGIPKEYLINSRKNRLRLLAGLLDGDGDYGTKCYGIATKFHRLNDDILYLCRSLGYAAYSSYKTKRIKSIGFEGKYHIISISGNMIDIPAKVSHKKPETRVIKKSVLRTGFRIEKKDFGKWYGFTVDKDNRFLGEDFTIHKNSGKSTLLLWLLTQSNHKNILMLAFNKAIADELSGRVPRGVQAKTVHSLGFSVLRNNFTKVIPDQWVVYQYIMNHKIKEWTSDWNEDQMKKVKGYVMGIKEIVDFYRIALCNNFLEFREFMSKQGKNHHTEADFLRAMEVLNELNDGYRVSKKKGLPIDIDFIGMLYLPIYLKLRFPKFREVFTDESQDFSNLMWSIAQKCVSSRGRLVMVGDSSQSIYSFTGSSPEIFLDKISGSGNTITKSLPVSYRCSKSVCEEAANYCDNEIIPFEGNPEGNVGEANFEYAEWGDFVLCRTNKPLMAAYYTLLGQGTKCYIKDKDLGETLMNEIKPFIKQPCMGSYKSHVQTEIAKLISKMIEKGVENPEKTSKYREYKEKTDLVMYLGAINDDNPKKTFKSLQEMFKDKAEKGVALMTIHKSKGLEAGTVFLICPELIPSKFATTPEMLQQERNLMFVAITRAINNFFYDRSFTAKQL